MMPEYFSNVDGNFQLQILYFSKCVLPDNTFREAERLKPRKEWNCPIPATTLLKTSDVQYSARI